MAEIRLLAPVVAAILSWALIPSGQASIDPPCANEVGLCINALATEVTAQGHVSVHTTVTDVSETSVSGKVWWVLAPLGPGAPWDRAVFESDPDNASYTPHLARAITWNTDVALVGGFYQLGLIVHRINSDKSETHSDFRMVGPIYVTQPFGSAWLIRRQGGMAPVTVVGVSEGKTLGNSVNPLSRTITIRNSAEVGHQIGLVVVARAAFSGWENSWWIGSDLYSTQAMTAFVEPEHSKSITVDDKASNPLLWSFPNVQIWVRLIAESHVIDEVLLGSAQTFTASPSGHLHRLGPPSGPVELTDIVDVGPWSRIGRHQVQISLANLTANRQQVKTWWYLAPLDDPHPWLNANAGGIPVLTTLAPWETVRVTIRAYDHASAGKWELSVWAHNNHGNGTFSETDALWLVPNVTVN